MATHGHLMGQYSVNLFRKFILKYCLKGNDEIDKDGIGYRGNGRI